MSRFPSKNKDDEEINLSSRIRINFIIMVDDAISVWPEHVVSR